MIVNVGPSAAGTGPCSVLGFLGYVGDLAFNLEVGFQLVRSKAYYCASGYSVTVRVIGQLHSEVYISASMKFLETRYMYYIFPPEVLIMSGANQAKILLSQRIRDLDLQNRQSQANKICSLLSVLRISIMGLKWQTIYRCQIFLNKGMLQLSVPLQKNSQNTLLLHTYRIRRVSMLDVPYFNIYGKIRFLILERTNLMCIINFGLI